MKRGKRKKYIWEEHDIEFLKANYMDLSAAELARALGATLTVVRNKKYELGLLKMKMEYWTPEQVQFLKNNYQKIGDVELAEIFEKKWPKTKKWTNKHIEKKRRYLHLKRTEEEKRNIKNRNIEMGRFSMCAAKRWKTIGVTPVGEIRIWKHSNGTPFAVIKLESGFVHYNRWLYQEHFGRLESDQIVVTKSGETVAQGPEDLKIIDRAELSRRNSLNRYPEELRETIRLTRNINQVIHSKNGK